MYNNFFFSLVRRAVMTWLGTQGKIGVEKLLVLERLRREGLLVSAW